MAAVIEFAPSNAKVIYMGGASANTMVHPENFSGQGIAVSKDRGETWESITGPEFNHVPVMDIAIDSSDPETVYAATQNGLFKSTNSGEDWTSFSGLPEGAVRTTGISPKNPDMLFAGIEQIGFYLSQDGGVSWQQVSAGLEPNGSHRDLVFDPANPQIGYLADLMSGVYRSTDGGISWVKINTGLSTRAVTSLSISSDGQHLYAGTNGEGVFRLDLNGMPPEVVISEPAKASADEESNPSPTTDSPEENSEDISYLNENIPNYQTSSARKLIYVGIAVALIAGGFLVWFVIIRKQNPREK